MKVKYTKERLETIVKKCLSIAQVCRELGLRPVGGNYKTLNKKFKEYEIDISHFTGKAWNQGSRYRNFGKVSKLEEILIENSSYTNSSSLKKKLYGEGLKDEVCEICGIIEWNGVKIKLELDHINGNNMDNRIENLRVICPNCHSQTKTYRGKKRKKSKREEFRKNKYETRDNIEIIRNEIKKNKRIVTSKNVCARKSCDNLVAKKSNKYCSRECYAAYAESNIPSAGELIDKFKEFKNFIQVGKYYNVSDNAVRKWCKKYDIENIVKNI